MSDYNGAYTGGRKPRNNFGINQNQQGQGNTFVQRPKDRLVQVERYDLTEQKIYCTDVQDGRKLVVHLNAEQKRKDEEYARNNPPEKPYVGMVGYSIDKHMEAEYPAKTQSRLILKYTKVLKKDNGEGYAVVETTQVRGVPNKENDKTFYALVGGRPRIDEEGFVCLARASIWDRIRKTGLSYEDDAGCEEMATMIEERNKNSARVLVNDKGEDVKETLPIIGVQFRSLVDSGKVDKDGQPIMHEFGMSDLFDWIDGPEDEKGNIIKEQSHPMTGQEFLSYFDGYADWIKNDPFSKQLAEKTPIEIEAVVYESAPGSRTKNLKIGHKSDEKTKSKQLYKLINTKSFLDVKQQSPIYHDNQAVLGIVQMSGNKFDKVNGAPHEVQSYWINNVHINGISGHPHAFIRSSKGYKVELLPELKPQYQRKNEESAKPAESQEYDHDYSAPAQDAPARQAPAQQAAPVQAQQVPEKSNAAEEDDPFSFNFFENGSAQSAEPAAPAAAPTEGRRRFSRG